MALPLIIFEIPKIKKNYRVNRFALLIGSILPDLIDKSLMFLGLGNGRMYSHTLLFVFVSFLIVYLLTKRNNAVSFPFLIGMIIHLLLDLPDVPLFYPFISYEFKDVEDPLSIWIQTLLTNPIVIATEIIGIIIFLFIMINNKLYSFQKIRNYLKTNPEFIIKEDS